MAVAGAEIVTVVPFTIDATVAPEGMPAPFTVIPTVIPAVDARPEIVVLAFVVLPAKTKLRTLAATIKARWICEQAHQQLKEELGLDHFEGRSWQGLHRHALMTMIAYAFLQHRRLAQAGRKKKNQRSAASAEPAGRTPSHRRSHRSTTTSAMPVLQKTNRRKAAA